VNIVLAISAVVVGWFLLAVGAALFIGRMLRVVSDDAMMAARRASHHAGDVDP